MKVATAEEAASHMIGRKKIAIMTGAGISVASGIPTFFRLNDFSTDRKRYADESDTSQILTRNFFDLNPMAVWEWYYDFRKLMVGKTPNEGHKVIAKFQEFCQ